MGMSVEYYDRIKTDRQLFDVRRVQKAYSSIPIITRNTSQYYEWSGTLKHVFERHRSQYT